MSLVILITVDVLLVGVFIFLIFVPLLLPTDHFYHWHLAWFDMTRTLQVALGQSTPPLVVNLMVFCCIADVRTEETVRWVVWMLGAMFLVLVAVTAFPKPKLSRLCELGYQQSIIAIDRFNEGDKLQNLNLFKLPELRFRAGLHCRKTGANLPNRVWDVANGRSHILVKGW